MSYYFTIDSQKVQGPASLEQLATYVREGRLPPTVLICAAGAQDWKPINTVVPAIQLAKQPMTAQQPSPVPQATATPSAQPAAAASAQPVQAESAQPAAAMAATRPSPTQTSQTSSAGAASPNRPATAAQAQTPPSAARPDIDPAGSPRATSAAQVEVRPETTALAVRPDFRDLAVPSKRSVDAKQHVSKGTGLHTAIGLVVFGLVGLAGGIYITVLTLGIGPLLMGLFYWINLKRGHARIHGGSVHVNAEQFPDIHRCTQDFAERLGMQTLPEIYIVEGSVLNAFAAKLGKRKYVLLLDDIVHGCLLAGETKALSFIIAHELAHHALGHTGLIRSSISATYKPLSRCDEVSCDAVAADLVEDKEACARGLGLLLIGPQLVGNLNWRALDQQAGELMANKSWKGAEGSMSHPHLLRRYALLRGLA